MRWGVTSDITAPSGLQGGSWSLQPPAGGHAPRGSAGLWRGCRSHAVALQLNKAQEQYSELEERMEYIRGLHELIRNHFSLFSAETEALDISVRRQLPESPLPPGLPPPQARGPDCPLLAPQLLDMWEAFQFERSQASEFLLSKRHAIVPKLQQLMAVALVELEGLIGTALSSPFMDPAQEQKSMENQLTALGHQFQDTTSYLSELHQAYTSFTGTEALCLLPPPNPGSKPPQLTEGFGLKVLCPVCPEASSGDLTPSSVSFTYENCRTESSYIGYSAVLRMGRRTHSLEGKTDRGVLGCDEARELTLCRRTRRCLYSSTSLVSPCSGQHGLHASSQRRVEPAAGASLAHSTEPLILRLPCSGAASSLLPVKNSVGSGSFSPQVQSLLSDTSVHSKARCCFSVAFWPTSL